MRPVLAPPPPADLEPGGVRAFSVVIAAYQAAATIAEAVESVLSQTLSPHEVLWSRIAHVSTSGGASGFRTARGYDRCLEAMRRLRYPPAMPSGLFSDTRPDTQPI